MGADGHTKSAGRVYVFTSTAGGWKQAVELKGSDTVANDGFGYAVAVSGTTAIGGCAGPREGRRPDVYVHEHSSRLEAGCGAEGF